MTRADTAGPPVVVVAGDAILDRYVVTEAAGIDRKSGRTAARVRSSAATAGGAANAAVNVARLGARAELAARIGADPAGDELRRIVAAQGVGSLPPTAVTTLVKTRIYDAALQVLRLDEGDDTGSPDSSIDLAHLVSPRTDALLISDYGYGALKDPASSPAGGWPPIVVVDARRLERWRVLRPTASTCDAAQAARLCGVDLSVGSPGLGSRAADSLLAAAGTRALAITLGSRGAVLVRAGRPSHHIASPQPVDGSVAGSGDVFAAALTVGLASGLPIEVAVERAVTTASRATASAIERGSTAVVTDPVDAVGAVPAPPATDIGESLRAAAVWAAQQRERGARVVLAGGCFDLLHEGHVALLDGARRLGDVLVVAVNDDEGVRALKGRDRPIVDLAGRMRVLRALESVDHVVAFPGTSPGPLIEAIHPDVFVKGGDYTAQTLPEAPLLRRLGVELRILDLIPERSTTRMVERAAAAIVPGGRP